MPSFGKIQITIPEYSSGEMLQMIAPCACGLISKRDQETIKVNTSDTTMALVMSQSKIDTRHF